MFPSVVVNCLRVEGIAVLKLLAAAVLAATSQTQVAQSWSCSPRLTCSKIHSCEEARWYLENCGWGPMLDRDNDGSPCERLCGSNN